MSDFDYYFDSSEEKNTPEENSIINAVFLGNQEYLLKAIAKNPKCVNTRSYCYETFDFLLHIAIRNEQVDICKILMDSDLTLLKVLDNRHQPLQMNGQEITTKIELIY